jgi:hypothetical protein
MPDFITKAETTRLIAALALFLTALALVGATLKDYGVSWDEPPYYYASDLHVGWLRELPGHLLSGSIEKSLDDDAIKAAWHWNPYNVPHPPFSRVVSGLTKQWFYPALDKFSAYRLAPALFFAALVSVMFLWLSRIFNLATGLFSALSLILIPNLFGYAHLAVTDMPLAAMWFLTAFCFWRGLGSWKWSVLLGVVWGLALATKFPAILIPIPLLLWAHVFHRERYANNVISILFLAPAVMVAIQPYLWHQSGVRIVEFLYEGFSRGHRPDTSFSVFFQGHKYHTHQLPWYYPFFMLAVTAPLPFLALAGLAIVRLPWLQRRSTEVGLFAVNAGFIAILGLMPGAVLHDGVRQLLAALPFLAALAGAGFYLLTEALRHLVGRVKANGKQVLAGSTVSCLSFITLLISPALELYLVHPFQLSYYNMLVGGVRGAYERGLEVTYFMEAINPKFLRQLNERLPVNARVHASFANFMLNYYQKEGLLRKDIRIVKDGPFDFYALLNRRSVLGPRDAALINGSVVPYLSAGVSGVPLVSVYEFTKPKKNHPPSGPEPLE